MTASLLPFAISSPSKHTAKIAAFSAVCLLCLTPPDDASRLTEAIADWASVLIAALPYVVAGAFAAMLVERMRARGRACRSGIVVLLALCNPGCDCALNGYADALARANPSLAGCVLTFAAVASPAALAVTFAAFGVRMVIARVAGAAFAAALTAASWRFIRSAGAFREKGCGFESSPLRSLAAAISGIAWAAVLAALAKEFVPAQLWAQAPIAGVGAMAAILSPCSTADPLIAASFLHDSRAQLAFMLSAQGLGVRQLALLARGFGVTRALAAAACSAIACMCALAFA